MACAGCMTSCIGGCKFMCGSGCTGSCEGCSGTCQGRCSGTCQGSCDGSCQPCTGTCTTQCADGCGTGCGRWCEGYCEGCGDPCHSYCGFKCQQGCGTDCAENCGTVCSTGCGSACQFDCQSGCEGTEELVIPPPTEGAYIAPYNSSITVNSVGAYVENLDATYSYAGRKIKWYINGTYVAPDMELLPNRQSSDVKTFYNLQQATGYEVGCTVTNIVGYGDKTLDNITIFTAGIPITGNFVWTYKGYNPTTGELERGWDKVKGYGYYVGADEWNGLIANVKSKLQARSLYSSTTYPLTAVSSGMDFKATYFNEVRNAVGRLASLSEIDSKVTGDDVRAVEDLNRIVDRINTIF